MSLPKIKYQRISFTVNNAGQEIEIDGETDKLYNTCTGINVLLTDTNASFSKLQLDMNAQEVFPMYFEVIRIRFRTQAPFGYDYHPLDVVAGGSKIKGKYTDNKQASYPYDVTLSFRLENLQDK